MKKINDFKEFIEKLEETLNEIMNDMEISNKKPVNICISVNIIPVMAANPGDVFIVNKDKTPVDVLETEKKIYVLIGLAGIKPKDITLTFSGKALGIYVNNPENLVNEMVELPARINKTGIKTTYKNGILEIIFNKTKHIKKSRNSQQSF
ncbi:MAG: Hsp20/alpha crystallin family protein [Candidatus Methanoperedens sp.]|nr:Hsp20/alpha crystallin family protein [Candidatus Methanoperedens sp.]